MAYRAIGSYYNEFGKQFGSGLNRKEESILMPELTGYYPDTDPREFRKAVQDYFRNINTKIPPEGLRLNIALEDEGPLYKTDEEGEVVSVNMPINIRDYVIYRHALGHIEVGENEEEAEKYEHVRFYVDDTEGKSAIAADLNEREDRARLSYYEIAEDKSKIDHMLVLLGVSPKKMKLDDKKVELKKFATIDAELSADANTDRLDRFINMAEDKDLQIKYQIEEMVRVDVLERVGQRIVIKESGEEIGGDLKEATLWFKDKGNSQEVNILKARYKEFSTKA